MNDAPAYPIRHVFVYGTLRTGDVRWHFLEPFVLGEGNADTVPGDVFDTGFDYPGAVFTDGAAPDEMRVIHGQTFELRADTADRAIEVLDRVEGVVDGDYARVVVTTGAGTTAWAYAYGTGLDLVRIESGDWLTHRPLP
jgi:gamma-glutamylcyclotransferase (GGCT)/AIG2-like uncharacterized protein YtfP